MSILMSEAVVDANTPQYFSLKQNVEFAGMMPKQSKPKRSVRVVKM